MCIKLILVKWVIFNTKSTLKKEIFKYGDGEGGGEGTTHINLSRKADNNCTYIQVSLHSHTSGESAPEDPALGISDRFLCLKVLPQDGCRSAPCCGVRAVSVILIIAWPQAIEDAPIVVLLINHLGHHPGNGDWITSSVRVKTSGQVQHEEHGFQSLSIKLFTESGKFESTLCTHTVHFL